ncbi:adenylate/guanylate cyclase domain-containing protein [uncultured Zoogloea sp.]|uniref:adenylate/guanylate cyclase domain-containing protein n=1 Tax=uncultured Zoogloea sp. TaxID=160237 RepID=UPI0026348E67|nr:adenylate/guanylate cyclase domain-containing protein [uncultured Zoogloea sp.]
MPEPWLYPPPDHPVRRFLRAILDIGAHPDDDDEASIRKIRLNLASVLFATAALVWLAGNLLVDGNPMALAVAAVPVLAGIDLLLFMRHRRGGLYGPLQLGLMLTFPFAAQAFLGPTPATAGLPVWAILAPTAGLLCLGGKGSAPWFGGFVAITLAAGALLPTTAQPSALALACHVTLVATVIYVQLRFAMGQRNKTRERLADAHRQLRLAQERSERLLLNILPAPIAARLKDNTSTIADGHPEVVVMFADIVDYTRIASGMTPKAVFEMLNRIFCRFDELCEQHGLERIKTIGDGYMVAGGLHAHPIEPHAAMATLALDMQATLRNHDFTDGLELEVRIGIASGPVVGGVVGRAKFIYDLWGDTVNLAFRLCTEGEPSTIQCDSRAFERLHGAFAFAKPILLMLKGKGYVPVYRLQGPRIFAAPAATVIQPTRAT